MIDQNKGLKWKISESGQLSATINFWLCALNGWCLCCCYRWEEDRRDDGVKWNFLEHKGPLFAPDYEPLPDDVKFYYDGKCYVTYNFCVSVSEHMH